MMSYSLYWLVELVAPTATRRYFLQDLGGSASIPTETSRAFGGKHVQQWYLRSCCMLSIETCLQCSIPGISEWVLVVVEFPLFNAVNRSSRLYCHMTLLHCACLNRLAVLLFGDLWSMITKLQSKSGTKRLLSCLTIGCRIRQLDAGTLMKSMARVSSWQSSPRLPIAASRFKSQLAHLQQQFHGEPGMKAIATRWFLMQIQMSSPLPLALTCGPSLQVAVLSFWDLEFECYHVITHSSIGKIGDSFKRFQVFLGC